MRENEEYNLLQLNRNQLQTLADISKTALVSIRIKAINHLKEKFRNRVLILVPDQMNIIRNIQEVQKRHQLQMFLRFLKNLKY